MTLSGDFVLARADLEPKVQGRARRTKRGPSIMEAKTLSAMMSKLRSDVDFGPYVATRQTPVTHLATRRWLRILFLLAQYRADGAALLEGLWWLDQPLADLGGMSPFEATDTDEAFALANALVFLTGGRDIEPGTVKAELFAEFCASGDVLAKALDESPNGLLAETLRGLQESTGSLMTAQLLLTCRTMSNQPGTTLYRLARTGDIRAVEEFLRVEFGRD